MLGSTIEMAGGVGGATIARKSADQTLDQSSVTLQDVTDMLLAVGANDVWLIKVYIKFNANSTADFKYAFSIPSGGAITSAGNSYIAEVASGNYTNATSVTVASTADWSVYINLFYVGGGTAGNVQFKAAQNTSDASDVKVIANSCIIAHQLV